MEYNVMIQCTQNIYWSNQVINCFHLLIITLCMETSHSFFLVICKIYKRLLRTIHSHPTLLFRINTNLIQLFLKKTFVTSNILKFWFGLIWGFFFCTALGFDLRAYTSRSDMFFQNGVLWTICPGWLQVAVLLISASRAARITGVSHRTWPLKFFFF
jgi:hypothetical protein